MFIAPTPLQKQLYAHVVASDAAKSTMESGRAALVLIDLLKKICNSPMLLTRQEEMVSNPRTRKSWDVSDDWVLLGKSKRRDSQVRPGTDAQQHPLDGSGCVR